MASFYIFLPSNSNKENKIGSFTVKLPETIRLSGEWEISMREFNYTRSWYNIGNPQDAHIAMLNFPTAPSQTNMSIPLNNYDTPQQLMNAIQFSISQHFLKMYSKEGQRIKRASNQTKKLKKVYNNNTKKSTLGKVKKPVPIPKKVETPASSKDTKTTPTTKKVETPAPTTSKKVKTNASSKDTRPTKTTKKVKILTPAPTPKKVKTPAPTPKKVDTPASSKDTKTTPIPKKIESPEPPQKEKVLLSSRKIKKPKFSLYFDSTLGKSVLKNNQHMFYLATSEKIGYMLGFENGKINSKSEYLNGSQYTVAPYPPDMNAGIYALMVHCDLVAPQLVGNTYANLLRMVPVVGVFNETITNIYNDEQYVPVMQKTFDSIEININDDSGKLVNFLFGRTFVTLHFRKRQRWVA